MGGTQVIDTKDITWLAGLLEGEGCFRWLRSRHGNGKGTPTIVLAMSDEDVVKRVADLWARPVNGPYGPYRPGNLKTYKAIVFGNQAIQWMMTLYVLMGTRRRNKIQEVVQKWKNQ